MSVRRHVSELSRGAILWSKRTQPTQQKHFIRRHQNVQNCERVQTCTAHRPEATQTLSQRNEQTHSTVTPDSFTHTKILNHFTHLLSVTDFNLKLVIVILKVTNMKLCSQLLIFTRVTVSIFWCFNVKMKLNSLISEREPECTSYQEMINLFRVRCCILPH